MDLVFNALPDVFSYQSLRHASYDAPWLNDDGARSKGVAGAGRRPAHERPRARDSCGGRDRRDACPLCQEKQRRPLATYIRSKSRQDRREDSSIQELKEEEEEEEEEEQAEAAEAAGATGAAAAHATAHATAAADAHTTPAAART